jgi:antitoxin YefM
VRTINHATARQHLAETMDAVNNDRTPILITRQSGEPVVMMSLADFNALEETAYLLRSPGNANRLARSTESLRKGRVRRQEVTGR